MSTNSDDNTKLSANPIFSDNKLKLGIFGINGKGTANTLISDFHRPTWKANLVAAQLADAAGLEAIVSYSRWKGHELGKLEHPSGIVLDPFTWAAGIAQATRYAAVFATTHASTYHPITVAKQAATIDIISGGRFGLNVVAGWNRSEIEMFGTSLREHEERYKYLAEWMEIVLRLWTETGEFDHHGDFFDVVRGGSRPQPLQKPHPPIMNAASSDAGLAFATRIADMCFVQLPANEPGQWRSQVNAYKATAREKHGREIQIWTMVTVVQRETQAEADAYLRHYAVDNADEETLDAFIGTISTNSKKIAQSDMTDRRIRAAAGAGGTLLVGEAHKIADQMTSLSDSGIDGLLISWVNFEDGLKRLAADVLPLLEVSGLRLPFQPCA